MNILILLAIAIIFASTALYSQFSVNAQSIKKEITEKTLHTVRNNTAGSSGLTDSSDSSPETTDFAEKTEDLSNITENNNISNESIRKQENNSMIENSTIYQDLGLQISFSYPWMIHENSQKLNDCSMGFCAIILALDGEESKEIWFTKEKNVCKCDTLEEYARYIYTNQISKFDDFSFINDNQTTISENRSAIQLEYERSGDNKKLHNFEIITQDKDSFYRFMYQVDSESFSKYLPDFKKMINNIKFISQNETIERQPSFMKDFEDELEQTVGNSINKLEVIRAVLLDVDKNCNVKYKDTTILSPEVIKALENIAKIQQGGLPEDWCKQGIGWLKIECDLHYDISQLCQANMPSIKKFLAREYIDNVDAKYLHTQYEKRLEKYLSPNGKE